MMRSAASAAMACGSTLYFSRELEVLTPVAIRSSMQRTTTCNGSSPSRGREKTARGWLMRLSPSHGVFITSGNGKAAGRSLGLVRALSTGSVSQFLLMMTSIFFISVMFFMVVTLISCVASGNCSYRGRYPIKRSDVRFSSRRQGKKDKVHDIAADCIPQRLGTYMM